MKKRHDLENGCSSNEEQIDNLEKQLKDAQFMHRESGSVEREGCRKEFSIKYIQSLYRVQRERENERERERERERKRERERERERGGERETERQREQR